METQPGKEEREERAAEVKEWGKQQETETGMKRGKGWGAAGRQAVRKGKLSRCG